MPSSKLLSLLTLLPAAALATDNASVQPSGLVRHSLYAQEGGSLFSRHSKRQLATASSTKRAGTLYTINLKFGTPGQSVPVQIDTTQSELFANPRCATSTNPTFCSSQPRFTMSSTLIDLGVQGALQLRDNGFVDFQYVSDYIGIESARITQQIFGVAYNSNGPTNAILGLGPSLSGWANGYPLVLDSLVAQGHIRSRAWSLDVKGFASQSGSVIFGGIDTNKFSGELTKLPIVPAAQSPDGWTRYWIRLDGLSVNKADGSVVDAWAKPDGGAGQPFVIDSGASLTALPSSIYNQFVAAFPSATANDDGTLVIDCPTEGEGGSVNFIFAGKVINVPFTDFVSRVPDTNTCLLGVYEDSFPVLGANFLRAAYVVFDQDNRSIHLAQSADCGAQSLVAIGIGANAVPLVTGACPAPVTSPTTTETSTTTEEAATVTTEEPTVTTEEATTTATEEATITTEEATAITESATESATETATEAEESECETEYESATESATETATESATETSAAEPSITATETSAIETSAVETASFPITTTAPPLLTITYTETSTSTTTSCPPSVPKCPVGSVTIVTQVITATTSICPQTTATYTFPAVNPSKPPVVVTLTPVEPLPAPVTVPGCSCTASPFPTGTGLAPGQPTTLATVPQAPGTGVPHLPSAGVPRVPGTDVPHVPGTDVPHFPGIDAPQVPATQVPQVPGTQVPYLPGTGIPPVPTHPSHGGQNRTNPIPTAVPPPAQITEPVTAGSARMMASWGAAAVVGGVLAAML
ncbi:aspartic peptidase domain-containing protein [Triangularia verruculosa]|uniref:Aspartic peptidase domain-containing protein n=1 Tax=Triangularia verruculosa TaxID=2587418 RepID=A0AAN6X776_9PEZI|nr:aspartic peptidase domain-containing protein [Triangularia verruculosa]